MDAGEGEGQMRSHSFPVRTLTALLSLPIAACAMAQNSTGGVAAQTQTQTSAQQNAITDRYLTAVQVEMASKVDTKNAVAGQEVSARTLQAATLADGTTLPKGTRLVGHVIQVKAGGQEQGMAILALTFDRAEVKGGQNVAVRSVIRTLGPSAGASSNRDVFPEQPSMSSPSVGTMGGGSTRSGGGVAGGMPGTTMPTIGGGGIGSTSPSSGTSRGGPLGSTIPSAGTSRGGPVGSNGPSVADTPTLGGRVADPGSLGAPSSTENRRVVDAGESVSAAPRATGLPGVMLLASPNASGTLTAFGRNISLDSGTQITLGVITR
jgi:hypothetical protein